MVGMGCQVALLLLLSFLFYATAQNMPEVTTPSPSMASSQQPDQANVLDGTQESFQRLLNQYFSEAQTIGSKFNEPGSYTAHVSSGSGPGATTGPTTQKSSKGRRPNFLVIMTDDQDLLLNSTHPAYMPSLHNEIGDHGVWMRSFSVSSTVCCPSRVNFLTGKFTHNTNVTSNLPPQGGYIKFQRMGLDRSYLPAWLQTLDYRTYFTGKFLNGFDPTAKYQRCPAGWTTFEPLIRPNVLNYWHTSFTHSCEYQYQLHNQYSTDILLNKTLSYIIDAAQHPEQPFFIVAAPIAPHDACVSTDDGPDGDTCSHSPQPAPRHANLYQDVELPRSPNYGLAPPSNTLNWVDVKVKSHRAWNTTRMNEWYTSRLQALRAVDEMISATVNVLKLLRQLDNTYVIFMSDNGFKIGNHGISKGKLTAYEEDVRVPFFIRGPGIPEGMTSDYPATMCDIPATILDLAGGLQPSAVDGTPIPFKHLLNFTPQHFAGGPPGTQVQGQNQLDVLRDQVPHEMWVWGSDSRLTDLDYRAVRICTTYLGFGSPSLYRAAAASPRATFGFRMSGVIHNSNPKEDVIHDQPITCYKYVVWCTGVHELYDLMLDPAETYNRYDTAPEHLVQRLDAYLSVQAKCMGKDCYSPYSILHPNGSVTTFEQAMDPKYDAIYAPLMRYKFDECKLYYYEENEHSWFKYSDPHYQKATLMAQDGIGGMPEYSWSRSEQPRRCIVIEINMSIEHVQSIDCS